MTTLDVPRDARLEPGLRLMFGLVGALARIGLAPSPASAAGQPAAKRQLSKPQRWQSHDACPDVTVRETTIPGRGGDLRIRLYTPPAAAPGGPAILYIHGGGFVMGGLDACHWICAELAGRSGLPIASVEYRLAPDEKFPAALEDCYDALVWLVDGGPTGTAPSGVAVAGDSAGGNLAAALCLLCRASDGPMPLHQTLIYPVLDSSLSSASWRQCAGAGLDVSTGKMMMTMYAGDHDWQDPLVSPLHSTDLSGLPPAHIVTADWDVLHDDGWAYAERLREAGVEATFANYPGTPHGFLSLNRLCKAATPAISEVALRIVGAVASSAEGG